MQAINPRNLVLKQLLYQLNEQYQKNTLDINSSLRNATQSVLDNQKQLKLDISQVQEANIREQLTLFMFAFTKAPTIWAQLLRNDGISTDTTKIVINKPQTITKVYKQIIKQTNILIHQSKAKVKGQETNDQQTQQNAQKIEHFDFQKHYVTQQTKSMLANLLNNLANQICTFYKQGKNLILKQVSSIQSKIKDSLIMNAYYLFGMLKQMSSYTYVKIQEEMSEYFSNLPAATIRNFCRYVQKNYQLVQLTCQESIPKIFNQEEQKQSIEIENDFWLNFLKSFSDDELTLQKVKSTQGETGFMLIKNKKNQKDQKQEDVENFEDAQKLILKVSQDNKIMVTNSRASQKKWEIVNIKDSVSNLYKILKRQIGQQAGGQIQNQVIAYGIPLGQYANVGGNIGRCLADINKYKNANSFFKDLSTSTVIGGSMTYVLTQIPILSYFVIAGGLSYTFYHTFNNKATSKLKKLKQLGKTSITAVGSVGSAVAGMVIGQTIIPVPFLGAFVGGVIGGFLGQTGANLMNNLMAKQSYKNLINYLKQEVKDGYWVYTPQLLQKLGISKNYFKQNICQKQNQKDAYITAICFCVVSSYEAKRYITRNQQKIKELQSKKQKKQEIQLLNQQQAFETEFDIVGIIDYLTHQKIILIKEHDKLQKCIKHLNI